MSYTFIKEFANVTLADFSGRQTIFLYRLDPCTDWDKVYGSEEINITYLFSNPELLAMVYPKLIPILNTIEDKYLSGYFNSGSNLGLFWFYFDNEGDYL